MCLRPHIASSAPTTSADSKTDLNPSRDSGGSTVPAFTPAVLDEGQEDYIAYRTKVLGLPRISEEYIEVLKAYRSLSRSLTLCSLLALTAETVEHQQAGRFRASEPWEPGGAASSTLFPVGSLPSFHHPSLGSPPGLSTQSRFWLA